MSDINNFVASIKNNGLARTNRYAVMLGGITWADPALMKNTVMFCDQIQLPGTNMNTSDIRTYGEIRKTPYERLYEDINMSFYVDTDMSVKTLFDYWINQIQDPVTRNWNYYENYTSDITIEVQDIQNKTRYNMRLREAYPKSIGAIQLDYNSKDVMKLSVNFAYKFYEVGGVQALQNGEVISYPGSVNTSDDALTGLTNRLKNFAIGSAGAYGVTKLQQLTSKIPQITF
jgi:hypothetical protein